jgi:hypothetical protein
MIPDDNRGEVIDIGETAEHVGTDNGAILHCDHFIRRRMWCVNSQNQSVIILHVAIIKEVAQVWLFLSVLKNRNFRISTGPLNKHTKETTPELRP